MGEYLDHELKHVRDPRSTDELFRLALGPLNDEENDPRWDAVVSLHYRATREVFERAAQLCSHGDAHERATGADVLGQLGVLNAVFTEERVAILTGLLRNDSDPTVLKNAAIALGHMHDPRAIEPLCALASHTVASVRYGVVSGLTGHRDARAIAALIQLSEDTDFDTRNWATFALGSQIETDTPEIRAALWKRIADFDSEIRGEAFVGLAERRDQSIVNALIEELGKEEVGPLALEAADLLSNIRLVPALERLQTECPEDEKIQAALQSCRTGVPSYPPRCDQ